LHFESPPDRAISSLPKLLQIQNQLAIKLKMLKRDLKKRALKKLGKQEATRNGKKTTKQLQYLTMEIIMKYL